MQYEPGVPWCIGNQRLGQTYNVSNEPNDQHERSLTSKKDGTF